MKKFLRILFIAAILILVIVIALFSLRFYNANKYNVSDMQETDNYHDLSDYPGQFSNGTVQYFENGMASGFHLQPDTPIEAEPIVVFGGSEGSSNFPLAEQIAEQGYEVYSLFFFGADNQVDTLNKIPLEFFQNFLDEAELNNEDITIIGGSKGAELALVLTNYYNEVHHLVLYTPSSYIYQGLDFNEEAGSSWTWEDTELPYIDITQSSFPSFIKLMFDMFVLNPVSYRPTYETAVEMNGHSQEARIDLSNFDGHALLLAGEQDAMWQGDIAAKEIGEVLDDQAEVVIYPEAGHLFGAPPQLAGMKLGGTEEANIEAKQDSDQKLFEFLNKYSAD